MQTVRYSGDEFRQARESANLSRAELAARSCTFVYEIMNLEAGEKVPPNKLPKIIEVLEDYLPDREDGPRRKKRRRRSPNPL